MAGSITKATHDQWALSHRCQLAHIHNLEAGVRTLMHRLSRPIGDKGTKRVPGGYRSEHEWFVKSRRLAALERRLDAARAEREAGIVHVVRGGRRLFNIRHNLEKARLTETEWRQRWEAERWFLAADGESGKRYGNETIRVTPDGEVSIKLPAPLAHLANAKHSRYILASRIQFKHRGEEWGDRVHGNRAVAYRIHYDVARGRWYLTASWQRPVVKTIPLETARAGGMIGVDTNADHFAAYRLDRHGNPVGAPHRFFYDLTGSANHRDAQIRHAITGSCTGPNVPVWLRSASRTWTSPRRSPARSMAVRRGSGSSSPASPPANSRRGWCRWRLRGTYPSSRWTRPTPACGARSTGRSP